LFNRHQLDTKVLGDLQYHTVTNSAPLTVHRLLEVPWLGRCQADAQFAPVLDLLRGRCLLLRHCGARRHHAQRGPDDDAHESSLAHSAHIRLLRYKMKVAQMLHRGGAPLPSVPIVMTGPRASGGTITGTIATALPPAIKRILADPARQRILYPERRKNA